MKRIFAIFLVVAMLATLCSSVVTANTEAGDNGAGLETIMGVAPAYPKAKLEISTDSTYVAGDSLTVTIALNNIASEYGLSAIVSTFIYDNSVLTLTNAVDSMRAIDCITNAPGEEWYKENFCKLNSDGTISLGTMGGVEDVEAVAKEDGDVVFTFTFDVAEDATGDIWFYVPHDGTEVIESVRMSICAAEGSYIKVSEASSEEESSEVESSEAESSEAESSEAESSEEESSEVESSEVESSEEESSETESSEEESSEAVSSEESSEIIVPDSNYAAKLDVAVEDDYVAGGSIVVTVTVKDITVANGICAVSATFLYDNSVLALVNAVDADGKIDCITNAPGEEWYTENFCKLNSDGTITVAAMGGIEDANALLNEDGGLVFTFTFDVADGVNGDILFSVPDEGCEAIAIGDTLITLPVKGSSAIASESSEVESSEEESSEEESSEEESSEAESSEEESSEAESSEAESSEAESSEAESSEEESSEIPSEDESSEIPSEDESSEIPSEEESSEEESSEAESSEEESSEAESSEAESSETESSEDPSEDEPKSAAKFELSVNGDYVAGGTITVTVTVKDINVAEGLSAISAIFEFDESILTITNAVDKDGKIDCITKAPGEEWYKENFCKLNSDGTITLATMGGIEDANAVLKADGDIVFTFTFDIAEGTTGDILFTVPDEGCEVIAAGQMLAVPAAGASVTVSVVPSEESSEVESSEVESSEAESSEAESSEVESSEAESSEVESSEEESSEVESSEVESSEVESSEAESSEVESSEVESSEAEPSEEESSEAEPSEEPSAEESAEEPSADESSKGDTPAAGDVSSLIVFAILALVALAGSAVVVKSRK